MTFDLDFSIPPMSLLSFLNTLNMLIRAVLMSLSGNVNLSVSWGQFSRLSSVQIMPPCMFVCLVVSVWTSGAVALHLDERWIPCRA